LLAQAVDFLLFLCLLALVADVLRHALGRGLGDSDAAAVEPVAADVTSDIEPDKTNIQIRFTAIETRGIGFTTLSTRI
jgi:hypothetical protein